MADNHIKVIHLSFEDSFGAGRAAIRISNAVDKQGVDSKVYVLKKNEMADSHLINLKRIDRFKLKILSKISDKMFNKRYPNHQYFHVDSLGINLSKYAEVESADILHFHWVNEGIWSSSFVKSLIKTDKPVVWTMHDMWSFTGGCHYDDFCEKYTGNCGKCKVLNSDIQNDDASKAQKWKKEYLSKMNIQLVGCSNWITNQANASYICNTIKKKAICIPNPINAQVFKIYDKMLCKNLLGVNPQKQLILFGAVNVASDKRKGAQYIIEALKLLDPEKYVLGVFGSKNIDLGLDKFEIVNFGRINDDFHLALMYNAADVFVAPSVQENLANTVMEALACGTPVVAFDIGGMSDMIIHLENGYLACAFDVGDLAKGIQYNENIKRNRSEISKGIVDKFSEDIIGKKYLEVYKSLNKEKEV